MKDDLLFVLKMFGLTIVVVLIFQVKMGNRTLEMHFDEWVKSNILVDYIQEATDGGVALGKKGYQKADAGIHTLLAKIKRKRDRPKALLLSREKSDEAKKWDEGEDDQPHARSQTEIR